MTTEQFTFWLQGYLEISENPSLSLAQVQIIQDHLNLVFKKETPNMTSPANNKIIYTPQKDFSEPNTVCPCITITDAPRWEKGRFYANYSKEQAAPLIGQIENILGIKLPKNTQLIVDNVFEPEGAQYPRCSGSEIGLYGLCKDGTPGLRNIGRDEILYC